MPRAKPVPKDLPTEPDYWLKSLPHGNYLQTRHWRRRRDAYKQDVRARHRELICELCFHDHNNALYETISWNVHHITYERIAEEPNDDLILLCPPCHNLVHFPHSRQATHWANHALNAGKDLEQKAKKLHPNEATSPMHLEPEMWASQGIPIAAVR